MRTEATPEEKRFDQLADEYYDRFNISYGIGIGDQRPLSFHIEEIERCLRYNKPSEAFITEPYFDPD